MSVFIDEHREMHGVEPICGSLGIAPSTYCAVKKRQADPSARTRSAAILSEVRRVHDRAGGVYGADKVWWQLRREGIGLAGCTVDG